MAVGRAAWTTTREALAPEEQQPSSPSPAASNANWAASLLASGGIAPAEPAALVGLTPSQARMLATFGMGPEHLDDDAQRRLGHALSRLETMSACDDGEQAACEAMGAGPVAFNTRESVGARDQSVILEEAECRLELWTETSPLTGTPTRHILYQDIDGTILSGLSTEPVELGAASAPEASPDPVATSEEGLASFLEGAVLGDFSDNRSWSALAGQVAVGFVPYAGQLADLRDLAAAGRDLTNGEEGAGWRLLLAGVGVVPGVGDVLKAAGKVALGGAVSLGTVLARHGDELVEGAEAVARHGDGIADLAGPLGEALTARLVAGLPRETLVTLYRALGPEGLAALARGMDVETLARVSATLDAETLAALVSKGLDGHAIRELVDGMEPAALRALAETGTTDELVAATGRLAKERLSGQAGELRRTYLKGRGAPAGANAAAGELTLDDGRRLSSQATSKKEPMDRPRAASEGPDPGTGRGGHYEPGRHAAEDRVRDTDSEYKILSDLTDQLLAMGERAPSGKLRLYTERAPCDSCQRVIEQFNTRFPRIDLEISYDFTVLGEKL